jgi:transposase
LNAPPTARQNQWCVAVAYAKLIDTDERSARQRDILRSIPGLGQVATAAILTFLPEIGTLDRRQLGSLAGLVPHTRESGQWKGRSFISGGPQTPARRPLHASPRRHAP